MRGVQSLDQTIEKYSATLGREAEYTQHARISRLPANLMVHMVRFHWRRDIGKKAKIMVRAHVSFPLLPSPSLSCPSTRRNTNALTRLRSQRKVKFPFELDALEMVTDALKGRLADANGKVKAVEGERAERRKVRRRTKAVGGAASASTSGSGGTNAPSSASASAAEDVPMADAREDGKGKGRAEKAAPAAGELEDEGVLRARERQEFEACVDAELRADTGASVTGLFELCGAWLRCIYLAWVLTAVPGVCSDRDAQGRVRGRGALHRVREEGRVPCAQVGSGGRRRRL
jgi:ubiquitin carboxyl-terminal hydrolase 14